MKPHREDAVEQRQPLPQRRPVDDDTPDWWPYADEFPQWYVWRGVCGMVYARKPRSSPPIVVRGEDVIDLRDQISRVEGRSGWGSG